MAILTPAELVRIAGIRPELRALVLPIMQAVEDATGKKLTIPPRGGLRTYAQQVDLWNDRANNPYPVAQPGRSYHEFGAAVDLNIIGGTDDDYAMMATIVQQRYGLVSAYPSDRVHVRLPITLEQAQESWQNLQQVRTQSFTLIAVAAGVLLLVASTSRRS